MINSLDPASASFLNGLSMIQRRSERALTQITTGLKINTVSDDPSQIEGLLATRAELARTQTINQNLISVKTEVDVAENAVSSAVTLVERAQTFAAQGQPTSTTAATRIQLADELGAILTQLGRTANTSVNGRFIFSGDSDQTAPYAIDLTQPNPVSAYAGSLATRQVELPDGTTTRLARTAQDLFDGPNPQQNIFQTISSLRSALLNNDQVGIDAALPGLQTAGTYLNQQLALYGTTQNRVNDGISFGGTLVTQLKSRLSGIEDADVTQAITEMTQASTAQQAVLMARSKIPRSTLFDYLA